MDLYAAPCLQLPPTNASCSECMLAVVGYQHATEVVPRKRVNSISYALHTGGILHPVVLFGVEVGIRPSRAGRSFLAGALVRIDQVQATRGLMSSLWSCRAIMFLSGKHQLSVVLLWLERHSPRLPPAWTGTGVG